jgi:hypothetical protein
MGNGHMTLMTDVERLATPHRHKLDAPFSDDAKDRCGVLHYAYLTVCLHHCHLSPFALWTAFPSSLVERGSHDYYGDSVALGVAPRRQSQVP